MSPEGLGKERVPHSGQNMADHRHVLFNHGGCACSKVLFLARNKFNAVIEVTTFNSNGGLGVSCGCGIRGNLQPL